MERCRERKNLMTDGQWCFYFENWYETLPYLHPVRDTAPPICKSWLSAFPSYFSCPMCWYAQLLRRKRDFIWWLMIHPNKISAESKEATFQLVASCLDAKNTLQSVKSHPLWKNKMNEPFLIFFLSERAKLQLYLSKGSSRDEVNHLSLTFPSLRSFLKSADPHHF